MMHGSAAPLAPPYGRLSVLVVDDDDATRHGLVQAVKLLGHESRSARDRFEAWEMHGANRAAATRFSAASRRRWAVGCAKATCLYRYGGEKFVAVLPEQSLREAANVIDRLRRDVERLAIPTVGEHRVVTIGVGIAELDPAQDHMPEDWLRLTEAVLSTNQKTVSATASNPRSSENPRQIVRPSATFARRSVRLFPS